MTSMANAKKNPIPGTKFKNPRGITGTVLKQRSAEGKPLARFTCSNPSCKRTHDRASSDWHQVNRCRFCVAKGVQS